MGGDDAVHGDDGNVCCAAADVYYHVAPCLADVYPCANQSGNRLINEIRLSGAGAHGCLDHSTFFHVRDKGRHTDNDAWLGEPVSGDLENKLPDHVLCHPVVGDHAAGKGTDHFNIVRGLADHLIGTLAHSQDFLGVGMIGDRRGFAEYNALFP